METKILKKTNGSSKSNSSARKTQSVELTRKKLSQSDVPMWTLEESCRVARAIVDEHAGGPTKPLDVAHAMQVQPTSSGFRTLCGASIAYGLTDGGYNAETITITDLGRQIINSKPETSDGLAARRSATLRPRVIREFLQKYDGAKLPREDVALKFIADLGVPADVSKRAFDQVLAAAKTAKFFKEIGGNQFIDLKHSASPQSVTEHLTDEDDTEDPTLGQMAEQKSDRPSQHLNAQLEQNPPTPKSDPRERRVFVTHGKNKDLIPQLKQLLEFGEFQPVVSIERESVSKPVPDKVLDDMRSCGAAIIHVDADREVITKDGQNEIILNGNVLIEIGAAMALCRRRFILLVRDGIRLPSNLQGLYEVRYTGEKLDGDATLKLLKAFNEFKTEPLSSSN